MIKICYFAKTRETVGKSEELLDLAGGSATVASIIDILVARGAPYDSAFEDGRILAAINQEMTPLSAAVHDGDELAFFPPVTGG
jgi:molybdopterin synthase sulfur carrier subunit